jgi:lipoate-protein ligase A
MPVNLIYAVAEWRLLNTGLADGPENMAVDEALLESVAAQESPPVLRFYGWSPPCLSLGFRQAWNTIDHTFCQKSGWDVVRRPTGGRAILHIDELTYSVIAPVGEERVRGSILESYQTLSEALVSGLSQLDLAVSRSDAGRGGSSAGPACFDTPSDYEITVDGKKLVGSAQVRKRGVILQHGTIPLHGDLTRIVSGLRLPDQESKSLLTKKLVESATTLERALGYTVEPETVVREIELGFMKTLNLVFKQDRLTKNERKRTDFLIKEKYENDTWNKRR